MAIIRKYYATRKDKTKLYHTYSDNNKMIRKIGTSEEYIEAVDVENAPFEYEETDKDIPEEEKLQEIEIPKTEEE